jgi:diadenosine tetraphosphate (Ap4A) HIT family hydrolase
VADAKFHKVGDVSSKLKRYINERMKMSHVYQPVMLRTILSNGGEATTTQIAKALLSRDISQIEYYEERVKQMVGKVLVKNDIVSKDKNIYRIPDFAELTDDEVTDLIKDCDLKLEAFLAKRGDSAWSHRTKSSGYISGSIRFEILKRARSRCELCGISAERKALEVDHILPRNKGGSDDPSNLQALCYSCNAMKRDTDSTDFRGWFDSYAARDESCPFCNLERELVAENELSVAFRDLYPVTPLHTLIIPKRHVADYFELHQPELNAINQLVKHVREAILLADSSVEGFNIGANAGEASGQTIFHCHVHLIPRRQGDTAEPRGGVRGVIPNKQAY